MRLWDEIAALFDAYDEDDEERRRREERQRLLEEEKQRQKEKEERLKEALEELEEQRKEEEKKAKEEALRQAKEEQEKEKIIQKAYEHLKQDGIEGYSQTPYCDGKGKNTVGVGYRIPNYDKIKDLTMTSQNAPISEDNPAWDEEKKRDFIKKLNTFCKDRNNWQDPIEQRKKYYTAYSENMPYFQEDELEDIAKSYIRKTALPEAEKNLGNLKMDFYRDLSPDAQTGMLDMQYNLGYPKFKLIDLYDHQQIDKSPLKFKEELKANPMRYKEEEINKDLIKNKYWPGLSMGLMNRDTAGVQSNLKRDGVGDIRHKAVKNLFNNPWREKEDNAFQNALPENPYSNLTVPGKEQDEEDLEELLKRLRRMQGGW